VTTTTDRSPVDLTSTGSSVTRRLGALLVVVTAGWLALALVLSPADRVQGEAVRLFYLHVPTVLVAFIAFGVTALGSALYLWKRSQFWDLTAAASAELGVVLTALAIVSGMLWGRPTWGVYWVWDARGTTTAFLLVLFLGYLAVRRLPGDPSVRSKRAAIAGLVAFVDVPIVHYSVSWWRTLHQGPTVTRLDPQIDGLMLFTFVVGLVAVSLWYVWLLVHRFRVAYLEERLDEQLFASALAERRAEAGAAGTPGQPAPLGSRP